ncbi:hypothetical protein IQ249_00415 [Lusitaniella coriacea LEGE 07157]|uniref:Lipoprotein n=1 Tax=Lusitaniella coriacea LEGE 07157 TaxID=945747 RepID=A0A8J7DUT2_9CYAN|nr:hypothetical protein [Lusitaniella coriacea]MBE9114350.1 hypothetical protein [Lusitaniella coriacea LEGE 07157]
MRNATILGILAASLLTVSCDSYENSASVSDVTKEEVIVLETTKKSEDISSINIKGRGQIDGEATIVLMLNGEPYKTETLKDEVQFSWDGDWYSNTAEIRYTPVQVNSGDLTLEYSF